MPQHRTAPSHVTLTSATKHTLCRFLGEARFTLGGLKELAINRTYPTRAALWPAHQPPPPSPSSSDPQPGNGPSTPSPPPPPPPDAAAATAPLPGLRGSASGRTASASFTHAPAAAAAAAAANDPMREALLATERQSSSALSSEQVILSPVDASSPAGNAKANGGSGGGVSAGGYAPAAAAGGQEQQQPQGAVDAARASSPSQRVFGAFPGGPPLPILAQFGEALPLRVPAYQEQMPAGWSLVPDKVRRRGAGPRACGSAGMRISLDTLSGARASYCVVFVAG